VLPANLDLWQPRLLLLPMGILYIRMRDLSGGGRSSEADVGAA
jgi:hypothetical protein